METNPVSRAVFALVLALAVQPAAAQQIAPGPLERLDDPPGLPATNTSPRKTLQRGGSVIVQVNVDEFGNNIVGDAANEPSIAVDPTAPNRIAIGWRQFDTITSNFRQAGWAWSNDGGRTWRRTSPGIIEPGVFRSDPVLGADADGTFYYLSLTWDFSTTMFISRDHGMTWPEGHFAFGGDKQWFTTDRTGGIGRSNIYEVWSPAATPFAPNTFSRSTDSGVTWMDLSELPDHPQWGTMSVGPDGTLFMAGRKRAAGWPVVRSTNAQDPSQTPAFSLASVNLDARPKSGQGPNPGGLLGQVWVATDHSAGPTRGNVYLLTSADILSEPVDPLDVVFARSEDGGTTWSAPVRVNDDPPRDNIWQWFGTMSVAPNGRIDVVWNDTRNSPDDSRFSELHYSFSLDAGRTWSPSAALSPPWNSHVGWPDQMKIGDYYDMVSDNLGANLAWAATFNGEQDVYYIHIGPRDCNGNSIPDTADIAAGISGDCNANGIPDECEIAAGAVADDNGDGVPDECQTCPADIDGDGDADVDDFFAFVVAFAAGDPAADVNGDGSIDVDDFFAFVAVFAAGCP